MQPQTFVRIVRATGFLNFTTNDNKCRHLQVTTTRFKTYLVWCNSQVTSHHTGKQKSGWRSCSTDFPFTWHKIIINLPLPVQYVFQKSLRAQCSVLTKAQMPSAQSKSEQNMAKMEVCACMCVSVSGRRGVSSPNTNLLLCFCSLL